MLQLKPLSHDSIPKALERAQHYRLLNEPWQAESICRDILFVESDHQGAILNLVLALTDQFGGKRRGLAHMAKELCQQMDNEYKKFYYQGIVEERMGKTSLRRATPRVRYIAYEHYRHAMDFYEKAEKIHPDDNEEAVLRWNACVRAIQDFKLEPAPDEKGYQPFLDV